MVYIIVSADSTAGIIYTIVLFFLHTIIIIDILESMVKVRGLKFEQFTVSNACITK